MVAFVASLLFVTLAEMGDKTQLLAMAFATKFPAGGARRRLAPWTTPPSPATTWPTSPGWPG